MEFTKCLRVVLIVAIFSCFFVSAKALACFQCGQYNDGVGSITPCINYTHMPMKECPSREHQYCIKYISEGSVVRDCVAQCTEKEHWATKTYCCNEHGCNAAMRTNLNIAPFGLLATAIVVSALNTFLLPLTIPGPSSSLKSAARK